MEAIPLAMRAMHNNKGRTTTSRATASAPNSFPQMNSLGSRSLTSKRSSEPRSRSVVMLVTASAVTARRLASAIGMTATATAKRSGFSARDSDKMPATAAANRSIQASRTITMVRPYAFVHISRQRMGFLQMFRVARRVVEPLVSRA